MELSEGGRRQPLGRGRTWNGRNLRLQALSSEKVSVVSFTSCPGQRRNVTWCASLSSPIKLLGPSRIFPPGTLVSQPLSAGPGCCPVSASTCSGVSRVFPQSLLYLNQILCFCPQTFVALCGHRVRSKSWNMVSKVHSTLSSTQVSSIL